MTSRDIVYKLKVVLTFIFYIFKLIIINVVKSEVSWIQKYIYKIVAVYVQAISIT